MHDWQRVPRHLRFRRMPPRRRTQGEKNEVAGFVSRLYELGGYDSTSEFASRAGLHGSNVGEYMAGKVMPDGYTLLKLMGSIGIDFTARGKAVDLPLPEVQHDHLRELAESIRVVTVDLKSQKAEVKRLQARVRTLEARPEPDAGAPTRQKKAS